MPCEKQVADSEVLASTIHAVLQASVSVPFGILPYPVFPYLDTTVQPNVQRWAQWAVVRKWWPEGETVVSARWEPYDSPGGTTVDRQILVDGDCELRAIWNIEGRTQVDSTIDPLYRFEYSRLFWTAVTPVESEEIIRSAAKRFALLGAFLYLQRTAVGRTPFIVDGEPMDIDGEIFEVR